MPLTEIWNADKSSVLQMTIEQIVSIAGDGKLSDQSKCQEEIRRYLNEASTDSLAGYAIYCLENAFSKRGQVLQDIVNEFGRRLDYAVENGWYQGSKNEIGFDGIWRDEDGKSLVVEITTSDVYRISLDTIANYRTSLIKSGLIKDDSSVLIVVGRTDTRELEAQVRGSRHAWHVRIIGLDSLIQLVRVKEESNSQEAIKIFRTLLAPLEYTRIDDLVAVVFAAARGVEKYDDQIVADQKTFDETSNQRNDKLSLARISLIRDKLVLAAGLHHGVSLIKRTRAMYWSSNHDLRIVCTVSKRYKTQGIVKYWYVYLPSWDLFLSEGSTASIVLGCVGLDKGFILPLDTIRAVLPFLNVTERKDQKTYWHLIITRSTDGSFVLKVPSPGKDILLSQFIVSVTVSDIE